MKCSFCDTDNPTGEPFCKNCGGSLDPATAPSSPIATTGASNTATAISSVGSSTTTTSTTTGANSGSLTPNAHLQNGRYVVEKILGQGGMGTAALAQDTRISNRRVVIKELISASPDPKQQQEDVRNFEREVEMLANLKHPLIPSVSDKFQESTRYFMVQEYAPGENLETHIEQLNQPMLEQEVLSYASQVLDILDYLSQQKPPIVHRDIKPANIVIGSQDKHAHLVDFGIARADAAKNVQRKQTSALGTSGYAPPEQYQGNADARSDLYALAATMHHLLTNRDPRNYPPFDYPPVRSLNTKLSAETERMLKKALEKNSKNRYQTPAEMKQAIDTILHTRFNVSTPPGGSNQPPPKVSRWWKRREVITLATVAVLGIAVGSIRLISQRQPPGPTAHASPTPTAKGIANAIGVTQIGQEKIGISDGSFAFDTQRANGNLKEQAATNVRQGNIGSAIALLSQAASVETNDAEALIYLENLRVKAVPHITIAVGTMLSPANQQTSGVSRDNLQGAYLAQKEFNEHQKLHGGLKVLLLIANSGSQAQYVDRVTQQILLLAKTDLTFVGVMGWPYSAWTLQAVQTLGAAHIPMVAQSSSSDALTGISPYFFRVNPSNKGQGIYGARYAEQVLHARKVALFVDVSDSFSQSLAQDFAQQFQADGNTIVATEQYTVGKPANIPSLLKDALDKKPELIYFSGYPSDVSVLLSNLAAGNLMVMGGSALYELGGYTKNVRAQLGRLRFTGFAYPDEWDIQGYGDQKPTFFSDYPAKYDPNHTHKAGVYSFTRASNDVMLSYDATVALLVGCNIVLDTGKKTITPEDLRTGLSQINGANTFQGVSGQIAFGSNGDPVDKAIVILYIDPQGRIHMEKTVEGRFLLQKKK